MGVNKIVVGMILIVIPIMALMLFFYLAWQSAPRYCWENLNAEKDIILSSLRSCVVKCWSKNNLGLDLATDDCNTISLIVKDKPISKEDMEGLEKYVRSYLDPVLIENTEYKIKIRYNHTGKEIAFVNVGVCGNKIIEKGERCEEADMSKCKDSDYSYGLCTTNKQCSSCLCTGDLDCNIQACAGGTPTKQNPDTNSDWCKYCKSADEKTLCNDQKDNDCDGNVDGDDSDCKKSTTSSCPVLPCGLGSNLVRVEVKTEKKGACENRGSCCNDGIPLNCEWGDRGICTPEECEKEEWEPGNRCGLYFNNRGSHVDKIQIVDQTAGGSSPVCDCGVQKDEEGRCMGSSEDGNFVFYLPADSHEYLICAHKEHWGVCESNNCIGITPQPGDVTYHIKMVTYCEVDPKIPCEVQKSSVDCSKSKK